MFIELTDTDGNNILVNLDHVADVRSRDRNDNETIVEFSNGRIFYGVQESYEYIKKKIASYQGGVR